MTKTAVIDPTSVPNFFPMVHYPLSLSRYDFLSKDTLAVILQLPTLTYHSVQLTCTEEEFPT
jgi:hypothetical protein